MTINFKIKQMIVDEMYLGKEVTLEAIDDEAPLFGQVGGKGLGLDSLDAIELVLLVKERFNVAIQSVDEGRLAFESVSALALFIEERLSQ